MSTQVFVVTELIDRDFSLPAIFESYEEAVQEMVSKIVPIVHESPEEVERSIWVSRMLQKKTRIGCSLPDFSVEAVIRAAETQTPIIVSAVNETGFVAKNGLTVSGTYKGHLINWVIHEINKKGENIMTKQFIVSEVIERNISEPSIHATLEAAQEDMAEKISEAFDMEKSEALKMILLAEEHSDDVIESEDENVGFSGRTAYGERYGQNFDWAIHEKKA